MAKPVSRRAFLQSVALAPIAAAIPAAAILPSSAAEAVSILPGGLTYAAGELSPVLYVNRTVYAWLKVKAEPVEWMGARRLPSVAEVGPLPTFRA